MSQPSFVSLVKGLGSPQVEWPPDPTPFTVAEVVSTYLRHRLAMTLRQLGHTPPDLAHRTNSPEVTWRSKLNGNRPLFIEDLITISAIEPRALEPYLTALTDLDFRNWVPDPYKRFLRAPTQADPLPVFTAAEIDWASMIDDIDVYISEQTDQGIGWAITQDVLVHELLHRADRQGLPARSATKAHAPQHEHAQLEWPTSDTAIRLLWFNPVATNAQQVRNELRSIADTLWAAEPSQVSELFVAIGASTQTTAALETVLATPLASPGFTTLSVSDANKLGHPAASTLPDIQVRKLQIGMGRLAWFEIKA